VNHRAGFALVLTLAAPVDASADCPAVAFIQRHRADISAMALRSGVPAAAIAGVIIAESTLNRNLADRAQDAWLATQLALHGDAWWDDWARTWSRETERAAGARWVGNKWPVSVIASGFVMSFGAAQIQPRTALRACAGATAKVPACAGGTKALMRALLDEAASIGLAALVLQFEALQWRDRTGRDVRADFGFLVTLYSSGGEYVYASQGAAGRKPNRMGAWLQPRLQQISLLLQSHDADLPGMQAAVLCESAGNVRRTAGRSRPGGPLRSAPALPSAPPAAPSARARTDL
jgi:hypothetical protein